MIREKINELLNERELSKGFKTELISADIFKLESLIETSEAKTVCYGNAPILKGVVGLIDEERKCFFPLFTNDVFDIKKSDHDKKLSYNSLTSKDVGKLFVLKFSNFDVSILDEWKVTQYFAEYKRIKNILNQKKSIKEKVAVKKNH